MSNHDNYDKNLLKALQDIAKSLRSIDSTLKTVNKEKEKTAPDLLECTNSADTTVLPTERLQKGGKLE